MRVIGLLTLVVVSVLGVASLFRGNIEWESPDFTFMSACERENGEIIPEIIENSSEYSGECELAPLVWPVVQIPLGVYSQAECEKESIDISQIVGWVNSDSGAGIEVMAVCDSEEEADVIIRCGVSEGEWRDRAFDRNGVVFYFRNKDGSMRAEVVTSTGLPPKLLFLVLCHEAVHVLGIGHSIRRNSIMGSWVYVPMTELSSPRLGDEQKEAIRSKYGKF